MNTKDDFVYIPSPEARRVMRLRGKAKARRAAMWCIGWAVVLLLPAGCVALFAA